MIKRVARGKEAMNVMDCIEMATYVCAICNEELANSMEFRHHLRQGCDSSIELIDIGDQSSRACSKATIDVLDRAVATECKYENNNDAFQLQVYGKCDEVLPGSMQFMQHSDTAVEATTHVTGDKESNAQTSENECGSSKRREFPYEEKRSPFQSFRQTNQTEESRKNNVSGKNIKEFKCAICLAKFEILSNFIQHVKKGCSSKGSPIDKTVIRRYEKYKDIGKTKTMVTGIKGSSSTPYTNTRNDENTNLHTVTRSPIDKSVKITANSSTVIRRYEKYKDICETTTMVTGIKGSSSTPYNNTRNDENKNVHTLTRRTNEETVVRHTCAIKGPEQKQVHTSSIQENNAKDYVLISNPVETVANKCDICNKYFKSAQELIRHQIRFALPAKREKLGMIILSNEYNMVKTEQEQHARVLMSCYSGHTVGRYYCNTCRNSLTTLEDLIKHVTGHLLGDLNETVKTSHKSDTKRLYQVNTHKKNVDFNPRRTGFKKKGNFKQFLLFASVQNKIKKYRITVCWHRQSVRTSNRAYRCDHCNRLFSGIGIMKMHILLHFDRELSKRSKLRHNTLADSKLCRAVQKSNRKHHHLRLGSNQVSGVCCLTRRTAFVNQNHSASHAYCDYFRKRVYTCDHCNKVFQSLRGTELHIRKLHT